MSMANLVFKNDSYNDMMILPIMMESLQKRILNIERWENTFMNDIDLEYIFTGLGNFARREKENKEEIEIMIPFVEDNIKSYLNTME